MANSALAGGSPGDLALDASGTTLQLQWDEVITSTLHGNSYPEQNGVWYRVYMGSSPGFVCNETTLVLTTQNPAATLNMAGCDRMFVKVVASDQP